jgi:hypothetical protein
MIESRVGLFVLHWVEMVEINGNDFCNFTKSANHYCFLSSFYICNCCVAGWATTTLFFLINIDSSHSLGEGERERERERELTQVFSNISSMMQKTRWNLFY